MTKRYDITVLTLIAQGSNKHLSDQITFFGVGESVRETIAGSCKTTLQWLRELPEDTTPQAWHLTYRTLVKVAGTDNIVSDTRLITFPPMDSTDMVRFKHWAIDQLRETADSVNAELVSGPRATEKRSYLSKLVRMWWTRK